MTALTWDPNSLDQTSAYVVLLHSEVESCLESLVESAVLTAVDAGRCGYCHPILLNFVAYYRGRLARNMPSLEELIPKRRRLNNDALTLVRVWDDLGGYLYLTSLLRSNHGAGIEYLVRLLHPVGIVIDRSRFGSYSGMGVQRLATLKLGAITEMNEFVELRGVAAHAGGKGFGDSQYLGSPAKVAARALYVLTLVERIARLVSRCTC
jgi:hypothetical protein